MGTQQRNRTNQSGRGSACLHHMSQTQGTGTPWRTSYATLLQKDTHVPVSPASCVALAFPTRAAPHTAHLPHTHTLFPPCPPARSPQRPSMVALAAASSSARREWRSMEPGGAAWMYLRSLLNSKHNSKYNSKDEQSRKRTSRSLALQLRWWRVAYVGATASGHGCACAAWGTRQSNK